MGFKGDTMENLEKYEMCWLEYKPLENKEYYRRWGNIIVFENYYDIKSCLKELKFFFKNSLELDLKYHKNLIDKSSLIIGRLEKIKEIFKPAEDWDKLINDEGFIIKTANLRENQRIIITGKNLNSLIYGIFELIKRIRLKEDPNNLNVIENPKVKFRMINHWDNLDGTIERGYAGKSIFFENNKIIYSERLRDYARLLASIGINGIVLNNVNVKKKEVELIEKYYLKKLFKIARLFGDYGIKIYLSINFASPIYLGGLNTADPLCQDVVLWWKKKIEEIYDIIPNFGGFLVKADSEFNPGPHIYGRTHADGSNMLARALAPFNGYVIWRAFVYNCMQDWRDTKTDRAKAAYDNFKPLDGLFDENVILQIKYGPMDFQVREPVSPLFGALEKTNQILELQITQEYTGQQIHLCYLGTLWKEILEFDTYARGEGSKVKKILEGEVFGNKNNGFAGVSNVGNSVNWTGHDLAQANLWTFGKISWNPHEGLEKITNEWIRLTFGDDKKVIENISYMLINSHRIYEKYTTPLGLGWMVNPGNHFGPNPEGYEYSYWGTYHRANLKAIGVDRTSKGTGFTLQYHHPWREIFDDIEKCPEDLLLFFHRVPYDYKLKSGKILLQFIYDSHFEGVEEIEKLKEKWLELEGKINKEKFERILAKLNQQIQHAKEWRDVINTYFYRKTGISDEKGRKIYP